MTPRRLAAAIGAAGLAVALLGACNAPLDEDRCVPPAADAPSGSPWVEWDDGDPCALDPDGTWREHDDDSVGGHRKAKKAVTATARPTTRPTRPAPRTIRSAARPDTRKAPTR